MDCSAAIEGSISRKPTTDNNAHASRHFGLAPLGAIGVHQKLCARTLRCTPALGHVQQLAVIE
jgi:hypothetical protein